MEEDFEALYIDEEENEKEEEGEEEEGKEKEKSRVKPLLKLAVRAVALQLRGLSAQVPRTSTSSDLFLLVSLKKIISCRVSFLLRTVRFPSPSSVIFVELDLFPFPLLHLLFFSFCGRGR